MAMLEVYELKPGAVREPGGLDKIVDKAIDFVVSQNTDSLWEAAIEKRVRAGGKRLRTIVGIGHREAP